jgi:hypothetical protein
VARSFFNPPPTHQYAAGDFLLSFTKIAWKKLVFHPPNPPPARLSQLARRRPTGLEIRDIFSSSNSQVGNPLDAVFMFSSALLGRAEALLAAYILAKNEEQRTEPPRARP